MAIETAGFQGTVSESQWAEIAKGFGQKYTLVEGPAVRSSGRIVYVDPRASVGAGVLVKNTTVESLTIPAPATGTGQWYLVALRRTWGASRGAAYVLIPGLAGTNAAQTAPPANFPAARNKQVGLLDDEPVAWAYTRSGTSTLQLWPMHARPSAVVPGLWALWDALEQGFMRAWSEADGAEALAVGSAWILQGYDTGWVACVRASGVGKQGTREPEVRRIGKTVHIRWGVTSANFTVNGNFDAFTIPAGFWPSGGGVYSPLATNRADSNGVTEISATTGLAKVRTGGSLGTYYMWDGISWLID